MVQRFYLDTSVFGGVFDPEFEEATTLLFEKLRLGGFSCIYSELSELEISRAPKIVQDFFKQLPEKYMEFVSVTPEAFKLAQTYISEKVVGKTSFDDCLHIAVATIQKADILVSWNFRHIVNVYRIRGYNSVNLRLGYAPLEIRSPKEIVGNENED